MLHIPTIIYTPLILPRTDKVFDEHDEHCMFTWAGDLMDGQLRQWKTEHDDKYKVTHTLQIIWMVLQIPT